MATQKQIEANRKNSAKSTGPQSDSGKSRSRLNATTHGMAARRAEAESDASPEFLGRRAKWAAEYHPTGEGGAWALDRAVAASLRIERCERAVDEITAEAQRRAKLAWDQDRDVEAATTAGRLSKDPVLASRQLQTTLAGAGLLVEAWLGLAAVLRAGDDWSDSQASKALDLLGVDPDLRSGRTPIDAPEGADPVAFRRELALREVDRLRALREEALGPLDEASRRLAMTDDLAMLSKPAQLVLRYERDAWRRYREAMKELKAQAPPPAVLAPPSLPRVAPPPPPPPVRPIEVERRPSGRVAASAPVRAEAAVRPRPTGLEVELPSLDELEHRLMTMPLETERTQFVDFSIGRAASWAPGHRTL